MIKILHLYYDLMNLYGESGNVKALVTNLNSIGIKTKLDKLTIGDDINFNDYDFIYIGSGTTENEEMVLKDILKYKDQINEYIKNDKFILSTGNSLELFGKDIEGINALDIFKYSTRYSNTRLVGDLILTVGFLKNKVLGFQNRSSFIENNEHLLFDEDNSYGVCYKNFYATYQIGPVLVRNPELLEFLIKKILKSKNLKYKKLDLKLENQAYINYFNNYYKK